MQTAHPENRLRRTLVWAGALCLLVLSIAFFVGYVGVGPVDFGPESRRADASVAAYRALGMPWEAKDLAPQPPVAPAEDAAPYIKRIINSAEAKAFGHDFKNMTRLADEGHYAELDQLLSNHSFYVRCAVDATDRTRVDFKRDYDKGPVLLFPEWATCKMFAKLFSLRAISAAGKGNEDKCISNIERIFRLSDQLRDDPAMIGALVSCAIKAIGFDATRRCASLFIDNQRALAKLAALPGRHTARSKVEQSIKFEVYQQLVVVRNPRFYGGPRGTLALVPAFEKTFGRRLDEKVNKQPYRRTGLPDGTVERAFANRVLEFWIEAKHKMDLHPGDDVAKANELQLLVDKVGRSTAFSNLILNILDEPYGDFGKLLSKDPAYLSVTEAYLAILRYRAKNGDFPVQLADVGSAWTDPFTGATLVYKRTWTGFRVYSVGPNRVDDGGIAPRESDKTVDDIVALYPPPRRKMP